MRRQLVVRFLFALLVYLGVEGASLAGLGILRRTRGITWFPAASRLEPAGLEALDKFLAQRSPARLGLDSALGWNRVPGGEINAAGMRDDREHAREPSSSVLRISAFGDSFTYGSDVALGQNWTKRISAISPGIEILNFGLGGYGLDQAYLRYLRQGAEYHPNIVFIGYMSENLARDVNVFRGFYGSEYRDFFYSKPRFKLVNDSLVLIPNPLRTVADYQRLRDNQEQVLGELGRNDFHFAGQYRSGPFDFSPSVRLGKLVAAQIRKRSQVPIFTSDGRYEPRSEAFRVTRRIFDDFYRRVLEDGALPIIIVLPDVYDQLRSRDGSPRRYEALLEHFRSKGYRYIDGLAALEAVKSQYPVKDLAVNWGHFSPLGNDIVARYILGQLVEWNLDEAPAADAAAAAERQRLGVNEKR